MSFSHKIWVEANGGTAKGFGCGRDDIRMNIYVGTSASYSNHLASVRLEFYEHGDEIDFYMNVDGQRYKSASFNRKTRVFSGITGYKIDGDPAEQERREKEGAESIMRSLGAVMAMGEIFADGDQKAANDWKERMLRAGMEGRGLIMPEDWGTLSEDEKQRRLDDVIKHLTEPIK